MRRNRMLVFHPKRNRVLKAAWGALLICALIPLGTPVYGSAGSNGNPFSNGSFFPNVGTFQGSVPGLGEGEGSTIVDSEFTLISTSFAQGGATTNFQSGGTNSVDSIVDNVIDLAAGGTANLPDGTTVAGPATITNAVTLTTSTVTPDVTTVDTTPDTLTQESGFIDTIANFQFVDVLYAAGSFLAQLRDSFPNQSFDGKGTFSFSQLVSSAEGIPVVATETVKIKVDGVRVSNDVLNFTPFEVQVPAVVVSFEVQRGGGG